MFIGLDLGTSGCRACVIDSHNRVLAQQRTSFPPPQSRGNAVEQDPAIWWDLCLQTLEAVINQIDPACIQSISVDGTSATVLLCDANGQVHSPALMYNDARAQEQARRIAAISPAHSAAQGPSSTLAKVLWFQDNGYPVGDLRILHQADWISGCLSGIFGYTDSNNSLKLGYDPLIKSQTNPWPSWLEQLNLPLTGFPKVFAPGQTVAHISPSIAQRLRLPAHTQIVAGTTDSTAAFIASGAHVAGDAVTSLGSTLVLKLLSDKPLFAPEYGIYSQPFFGRWLVGGASNSGAAVFLQYFSKEQLQQMTPLIKPQQDTELKYYPLSQPGERFPIADPTLAPQLSPRPDSDLEFFQGLLEGVAAVEKRGYDLLRDLCGVYPRRVFSNGGGADNQPWLEIRQRYLGVPVLKAEHTEAAFGAAKLAQWGCKSSLEEEI
ncbi:MAG: FGGY-family carbohydrate kinase [Gammaproteobacteria bacterium]|nr:FGGY-family carbohydrate kinase [Gammaproteobacteria bacterium]MDH5800186.1 FGGY-family carbohydrate kinase [Gammaproteobacteria bacterium]